jgi:hypothetical protein
VDDLLAFDYQLTTEKSSLCFSCHYGNHIISGKGSSFLQCQKHFENPRYPKYPVLPVFACSGYVYATG